jgi:hypothetical protein
MPVALKTSATFFAKETFTPWVPATNTFAGTPLVGRKKRIDPFVSLWHRSSRRVHILLDVDQFPALPFVLRHDNTGVPYLISETIESDAWIQDQRYTTMLRAHRCDGPSGGQAQFIAVRTQGTGNDLGPAVLQTAVTGFADVELRSTHKSEDSEETSVGEYFVAYSRNFATQEGDFILFGGSHYRIMEQHYDSGYHYSRASQESPKFKLAEFKLPSATTPAIFDPMTGTMTAQTEVSRQVSVLIGESAVSGEVTEARMQEKLTLYIYLNHIGFEPYLGQDVVIAGRRYRVTARSTRIEEKQIKLEVTP